MEGLIIGQQYYVKQQGTTINKVVRYDEYRAKFLGKQQGTNQYMTYNKVNYYKSNHRPTYLMVVNASQIIKMDTLKTITNEMLPNDILLTIDEYI
jgi:hypothetical protein